MVKGSFENLSLPEKRPPQGFAQGYRVYKTADEFVVVQADTAFGALEASGVKDAYKIEMESLEAIPLLDIQGWGKEEAAAAVVPAPEAPEA